MAEIGKRAVATTGVSGRPPIQRENLSHHPALRPQIYVYIHLHHEAPALS